MLTDAQVREFQELGMLLGPKVYTDAEADTLRERMHDVIDGRSAAKPELLRNIAGETENVVIQIVNTWEADDRFREHVYQPEICAMVAQLIGHPVLRVWHDQVQYKPPRIGGPTTWHQDHPYWPIIQPADLVSAWVALDDATVENGCMWMVPRSHHWGPHKGGTIGTDPETFAPQPDLSLLPPDVDVTPVPCEVKKGQVMFHHCLTWHGSPKNRSERGRPAIAVHYMPGYTRYEPNRTHPMERRVTVRPGEVLEGEFFPTVWDNGPVAH
ncbi:MAG TPA: phytanoyl-CoA dioxygenase family protein [Armatimonadota bacterium]|nr:phytanoyl-CoA dioxygenase family protein [Armatimonadota bacterium]